MEFDNTFEVASPVGAVWAAILDVERLAHCVPGARVLDRTAGRGHRVAMKVRLGHGSTTYTGDLQVLDPDPAKHVASLQVRAKEGRGPGTANANIVIRLAENGEATEGKVFTQLALSGRVAALGQDAVGDASGRLIDAFASNLAAMLGVAAPAASPPPARDVAAVPRPEAAVAPEPEPAPEPDPEPAPEPEAREPEPSRESEPEPEPDPKPAPDSEAAPPPASAPPAPARFKDPRVLGGLLAAIALIAVAVRRLATRG